MTTKVTGSVLSNTGVTGGFYGGATFIPVINVDAQGRLVSAANVAPGPFAIASGGTNNGNLLVTAGGVLYTDGTKIVNVGAGTSGQHLISNGINAPSWANQPKVYTLSKVTSSGTQTVPAGVTSMYIFAWGSVGGCSVTTVGSTGSGGIGGAGYSEIAITSPAASYSVTIGAAGTNAGTQGGTTTITGTGVSITITGSAGVTSSTGSNGGVGSGGTFNATGGKGGNAGITINSGGGGSGASGSRAGNGFAGGNGVGGGSGISGSPGGGGGTGSIGLSGTPPTAGNGGNAATAQASGVITLPIVPPSITFEAGGIYGYGAGGVMQTGFDTIYPNATGLGSSGGTNARVGWPGVVYILYVFG